MDYINVRPKAEE